MKKITIIFFIGFMSFLVNGQVPQGFNYQAVARSSTGNALNNTLLPVRISIQTSLTGGNLIWEETHSVTTNNFGIMTFVIGNGVKTGGSETKFEEIKWSSQALFLKTEIQYPGPGYTEMGATQLWAVPYSLVAKNLEGTVDKFGIKGTTDNNEEALFEVKNKSGQTVFAVYNEGVRIYVSDGDSKGAKGGFAIGGFSSTKTAQQNYFVVKPDTIRMYIDDTPGKSAKGGFAIGGFSTTKAQPQNLLVVNPDSIRVYIDTNTGKGAKGGFAIGGFSSAKASGEQYLRVTRDSTRIYLNDTGNKGAKGGFAIGGFSSAKGSGKDYMSINPDSTNFYIRTLNPDVSSTFNIVGIDPNSTQKSLFKANKDTIAVSNVFNLQNDLIVVGDLNIGGTLKQVPDLTTTAVNSITQTTAISGGDIASNGGAAVIESGICWSTSVNPTTELSTKTSDGSALGLFTSSITGLTSNTLYYVRAYARNSLGTAYGNEVSFTTLPIVPPTLSTTVASSITQTTALSGGNVLTNGGGSVTARGVCWNTSTNPTIANSKTTDGSGDGIYTSSLSGLTIGTVYYLRAYATNIAGTAYGNEISFTTTAATVATLITTAVSSITQTTAASGGNITSNGGAIVTVSGICWSYSANPTIALSTKTTDGTTIGVFSSNLTGLLADTAVYVRAYATNSVGTAYGNEISFNTIAAPLAVGNNYQGGIIAYILQSGDPGYISGETHGLIVAPNDQSTSIPWFNGSYIATGATGSALGTGNSNTNTIVASQGPGSYAAKLCYDLVLGGFSDWFLPSIDELSLIYTNRTAIGDFFPNTLYWSSTETSVNDAMSLYNTGWTWYNNKAATFWVRAVRSF